MKKVFPYLSVLILMVVTLGYQNCSKMEESAQEKSSSSPPPPPQVDPFSHIQQGSIQIISAEVKAGTNQVRVLGSCDLPGGKRGEISGKITKTSCSNCQPLSFGSTQCLSGQFQLTKSLSSELSITSENDVYTVSVDMSVIDNTSQNKESSVTHSLTASIENNVPGGGGNTIPDRFILSVSDACSQTTSWVKPTENCEENKKHGGSTKCSKVARTTPWEKDLDYGGAAHCRTLYRTDNYHNDSNESLSKRQSVRSRVYIHCPSGYSTSYDETICREIKSSDNSKPLDVSVSSCSVICTKDTGESAPTPPDSFTLSVNHTCSQTTPWVKPTENCEESSRHGGSTKCSEEVYIYPWTKALDYGATAICQTGYTNNNYHNDDNESLSKSQSANSSIYLKCPSGYDVSSHLCWDYKTNDDGSSMNLSISSCTATCTKKQDEN